MIDLGAELRAALESAGLSGDELDRRLEAAVERVLDRRAEHLETLAAILGCSAGAAATRLHRDAELRALGVRVGRRTLFRRAAVEDYYRAGGGR